MYSNKANTRLIAKWILEITITRNCFVLQCDSYRFEIILWDELAQNPPPQIPNTFIWP